MAQVKSPTIEEYLPSKINVVGDLWGIDYDRKTDFSIENGDIYYEGTKVDTDIFDNAIFFFCPPYIDMAEYNYLLSLEAALDYHEVNILNRPSDCMAAADKTYFYNLVNYNFSIPEYKTVRHLDDIPNWEYPFIVRSTRDAVTRNTHVVKNEEHFKSTVLSILAHGATNIIATKILDHDVCYRLAVVGGEIDWGYACPSDELFKRYTNLTKDSNRVVYYHNELQKMMKDPWIKGSFRILYDVVGVDTFVVDFTIVDGKIYLFEINIGFGMAREFVHSLYSPHGIDDFKDYENDLNSAEALDRILNGRELFNW